MHLEPRRSSILACPNSPPAMSMFQRVGTIYPGAPGATGRQARARSLAEHATSNTTKEANDRCRTPDDSTAKDEHSDHNRTTPATRQAPAWAPFTFQGLSRELKARGSWPFREGPTSSTHLDPSPLPPCAPIAVRRFNRRADENAHGTAQAHRAERLEEPWRTRRNARHPRATGAATSG